MAFNQGVYDFVVAYLNDPQTIINQMVRLNVNVDELADAIGMPTSQVISYFNNAGLQAPGMGYQEPGVEETPVVEQPSEPVVQAPEPSPAPQPEPAPVVEQPAVVDTFPARYAEMQGILSGIAGTGPADFEWWARNKTPDEARALVAQRYAQMESILKQLPNVGPADFQWWAKNKTLDEATNFVSQQKPTEAAPPVVTDQEVLDQVAQDQGGVVAPEPTPLPVVPETGISTAVEGEVGQKPREGLAPSKDFAESTAIALLPGLGDGLFDSQGNRHTSTFVKTYKVVDGQTVETPFTPQDVSSNDFIFYIGSKTGGEDRERAAQSYRLQDGKLVALGEPAYYKGAQDIGFFEGMLREGLPFIASVVPGLNVAIGAALGATSTVMAQALGNAVMNAALSVAAGAKPADALKNAAVSFGVSQLIPNLTGNQFIDNAIKAGATAQLTGGKVGDAIANSLIQTGAQAATQGLSITGDRVIDSGLVSAATSALQSQVTGADTGFSALQGFVSGANAALAQKPVTEIPGTSTTIGGGTATGTVAGGATQDLGMDTAVSGAQDDVLGIVAQEQEADRVASASQVLQAPGQMQKVTAEDAAILGLTPLYEQYQGPNGTLYMRDINTGKITQVLPQGAATNVAGGSVFLDKPQVIGAIEALPANALYQGVLYTNDPSLIGKAITSDVLNNISISSERDFNIRPVGNLEITQNADGTYTQRDKITGDSVTFDANNKVVEGGRNLSAYTKLNNAANFIAGSLTQAGGDLTASLAGSARLIGVDPSELVDIANRVARAGALMTPEQVNSDSNNFMRTIMDASKMSDGDWATVAKAAIQAAQLYPGGAGALGLIEIFQEGGQALLGLVPSLITNAMESAGAQLNQKIDELQRANPGMSKQEAARASLLDGKIAGAITAAIDLIPGVPSGVGRSILSGPLETLEEWAIAKATGESDATAVGKGIIGGIIGKQATVALEAGNPVIAGIEKNLGVAPGTYSGVSIGTGTNINVAGSTPQVVVTAPSLPADTTVDPGVDLTPDNLGTLPTTLPDVPEFEVAPEVPTTGVVVAVDANNNQASVIDDTGALTIVPANGLTPGQTTVLPAAPVVTAPTVPASTTPVVTETAPPVATEPTVTDGVVLQDNGDGTSLVLTQDGGATNVPSVDASTGLALAPGTSVTVDTSNNTATATGTDTSTATSAETTASADTGVTTSTGTTTETATGAETATDTGTVTDTATGVDTQTDTQTGVDATTQTQTQTQPETQTQTQPETVTQTQPETVTQTQPETVTQTQPETVTQVTPEPTPQINTEEPEPLQPEDLISPPPELTPEDQLLQQIIKELEKPTVPETPEPPPIEPPPFTPPESVVETPPITVEQQLTVSPKTVRPTVMPGSRVEETAQILPIRPGLSEGGTGGIEGTPEEEQQPVWNVRSLKLRRLLGI